MQRAKRIQKGFTLLEILLVIAAIGILASIVLVAINPTKQLAQIRNAQRLSNINTIFKAIEQRTIDIGGAYPGDIGIYKDICPIGVNTNCVDLSGLVTTYIAAIPLDPSGGNYQIAIHPINNRVSIKSPNIELGKPIWINKIMSVEYLVVGGGGAGGSGGNDNVKSGGGGGGAGGLLYGSTTVSNSASVTVGRGGVGAKYNQVVNGYVAATNSVLAVTGGTPLTATAGGLGGYGYDNVANGYAGGSGGGGSVRMDNPPTNTAGVGGATIGPPAQGSAGGSGRTATQYAGGGGGATQVGFDATSSASGKGGDGYVSSITGSAVAYAGGGGAGVSSGAGGNATYYGGGGGGGGQDTKGGNGGSGIVIIRYKTDGSSGIVSATGGTKTTVGEYTIHTFTTSGTFTLIEY